MVTAVSPSDPTPVALTYFVKELFPNKTNSAWQTYVWQPVLPVTFVMVSFNHKTDKIKFQSKQSTTLTWLFICSAGFLLQVCMQIEYKSDGKPQIQYSFQLSAAHASDQLYRRLFGWIGKPLSRSYSSHTISTIRPINNLYKTVA